MRRMTLGALVLISGLAVWFLAAPPAVSQIKVPADFAFDQGKESPGPVTFSHEQHKAKVSGVSRPGLQDEEGHLGAAHDGEDEGGRPMWHLP